MSRAGSVTRAPSTVQTVLLILGLAAASLLGTAVILIVFDAIVAGGPPAATPSVDVSGSVVLP